MAETDDPPVNASDVAGAYFAARREFYALQWDPVSEDYRRAKETLNKCAEVLEQASSPGNPRIWYAMGCLLKTTKDGKSEAEKWLRKAAEAGEPEAMLNLSLMLSQSDLLEEKQQSVVWQERAAAMGLTGAMTSLGFAYRDGEGVAQDYAQAIAWFKKAIDAGYHRAMMHIGRLYRSYDRQPLAALEWFLKAARAGCLDASIELAILYSNRETDLYDPTEAVKWYHIAAQNPGSSASRAMLELSRCYRDGCGVPSDWHVAREWLTRYCASFEAGTRSHKDAINMLAKFENELL